MYPGVIPATDQVGILGPVIYNSTQVIGYLAFTNFASGDFYIGIVRRPIGGGADVVLGIYRPIPRFDWACVEMKVVVSATVGILELRINGVAVETHTGLNTGTDPILRLVFGIGEAGSATPDANQTFYQDDIRFDDAAYPGLGQIIGRQVKAGTPTYNAWTKTGGATIDGVWSETPYSATLGAVSAGAGQAQTGLVADVAAGVNPIGSGDIVNACRVCCVANRESAGAAYSFYRLRRRVSAADTDTDMSFASLDTNLFHAGPIFTTTRTALQTAEMGAVVGTGGGGREDLTIHDIWMMVDYTPWFVQDLLIVPQAVARASYF